MSNGSPPRIGELVGGVKALQLVRAWRLAAGPIFGEKAKFHGLQRNAQNEWVLVLDLEDPIWKQELMYQSKALLEIFRETLRKQGFPVYELPVKVSLAPSKSLPFQSGNPKPGGHKGGL